VATHGGGQGGALGGARHPQGTVDVAGSKVEELTQVTGPVVVQEARTGRRRIVAGHGPA
jgi:hypothetical protein